MCCQGAPSQEEGQEGQGKVKELGGERPPWLHAPASSCLQASILWNHYITGAGVYKRPADIQPKTGRLNWPVIKKLYGSNGQQEQSDSTPIASLPCLGLLMHVGLTHRKSLDERGRRPAEIWPKHQYDWSKNPKLFDSNGQKD